MFGWFAEVPSQLKPSTLAASGGNVIKLAKTLIIVICCFLSVFSQQDTLIYYSIEDHQISHYALTTIDSTRNSDHTEWSYGNNNDHIELSTVPPDTTYNGSGFNSLVTAQTLFPVDLYPARTAVNLFKEVEGELIKQCSGILVSSQYVLTDCHCVGDRNSSDEYRFEFFDNMMAFPAFDNGSPNWEYGGSRGIGYVTFKSNIEPPFGKDIALIKLEKAIGDYAGWVGIGFNNDNSFFEDNAFHEFSYPGLHEDADGDSLYNGDTLFYNFGSMNDFSGPWMGYSGMGIPGQSGTSLVYTDNEVYYSYGTMVWGNTWHLRITPEIFYSFKAVLTSDPSNIRADSRIMTGYHQSNAFPNPFNSTARVTFSIPNDDHVVIRIFDLRGRELSRLVDEPKCAGKHDLIIDMSNFSSGVYIYQIYSGSFTESKKLILLK